MAEHSSWRQAKFISQYVHKCDLDSGEPKCRSARVLEPAFSFKFGHQVNSKGLHCLRAFHDWSSEPSITNNEGEPHLRPLTTISREDKPHLHIPDWLLSQLWLLRQQLLFFRFIQRYWKSSFMALCLDKHYHLLIWYCMNYPSKNVLLHKSQLCSFAYNYKVLLRVLGDCWCGLDVDYH